MPTPDEISEADKKLREAEKKIREQRKKLRQARGGAPPDDSYESHKTRSRLRQAEISAKAREIGPLPSVLDPQRKESCRLDLLKFARTYFANRFTLPFSGVHFTVIEKLQKAILEGGLVAYAMPRGSGKTTIVEVAAIWAAAYGHRRFLVIVAATSELAGLILDTIKLSFEENELLAQDFPEICYPVARLEGIHNRAKGQTLDGKRTKINWTDDTIKLPTVEGCPSSGIHIRTAGITGSIRGQKITGDGGEQIRPDFVILEDPQTDESARSPSQNATRERLINGAILGLAGPGNKISAVMACTVIAPGDLADRYLDKETHPQWQSERSKMLLSFPRNMEIVQQYAQIRKQSFRDFGDNRLGNEFYRENQAKIEDGAEVSWPERFEQDEVSGIQCALNIWIDNPVSFAAEYQNEPLTEALSHGLQLEQDQVASRLSGIDYRVVPRDCSRVTAFIDVGGSILWYAVVAWNESFGGSVIDYGGWPRQNRSYYSGNDARPSLEEQYPGRIKTQAIFSGVVDLLEYICGQPYQREAGGELRVDRVLVDSGWATEGPQVIYSAIKSSRHQGVVFPSKGFARSDTSRGVASWKLRSGERSGYHWRLTVSTDSRERQVQFDPDSWKTRVFQLLTCPLGGRTVLTLFGKRPEVHQLIADHLASESATPKTLHGITFDKWSLTIGRDNHLFDCLVGAAVAASVAGLDVVHDTTASPAPTASANKKTSKQAYEEKRRRR